MGVGRSRCAVADTATGALRVGGGVGVPSIKMFRWFRSLKIERKGGEELVDVLRAECVVLRVEGALLPVVCAPKVQKRKKDCEIRGQFVYFVDHNNF